MKNKWINVLMIVLFILIIIFKLVYKPEVSNLGLALPIFFLITNIIAFFKKEEDVK